MDKCKNCDQPAVWFYMPGDSCYCDDCVPRGCSCNDYSTLDEIGPTEEDGEEGKDWIWTNSDKTTWTTIDEKGRQYPCVEFFYEEIANKMFQDSRSLNSIETEALNLTIKNLIKSEPTLPGRK